MREPPPGAVDTANRILQACAGAGSLDTAMHRAARVTLGSLWGVLDQAVAAGRPTVGTALLLEYRAGLELADRELKKMGWAT